MGFDEVRFDVQCERIVVNRLLQVALLHQSVGQVRVCFRVGGLQVQRLAIMPDRILDLPLRVERLTQLLMCLGS